MATREQHTGLRCDFLNEDDDRRGMPDFVPVQSFPRRSTCGIGNDPWKVKSMAWSLHDPFMSSLLTEATRFPDIDSDQVIV